MFEYMATVTRVIDADTVVADIDVGFHITHRVTCRLLGVNAPEMSTAAGVAARTAVVSLIQGRTLEVRTVKDRGDKYWANPVDRHDRRHDVAERLADRAGLRRAVPVTG